MVLLHLDQLGPEHNNIACAATALRSSSAKVRAAESALMSSRAALVRAASRLPAGQSAAAVPWTPQSQSFSAICMYEKAVENNIRMVMRDLATSPKELPRVGRLAPTKRPPSSTILTPRILGIISNGVASGRPGTRSRRTVLDQLFRSSPSIPEAYEMATQVATSRPPSPGERYLRERQLRVSSATLSQPYSASCASPSLLASPSSPTLTLSPALSSASTTAGAGASSSSCLNPMVQIHHVLPEV